MKFGSTPTPITSTFTFSPVNLATLGATEYTLVGVTADRSGSVRDFAREMEKALKEIISACRKSPRADNLLLRLTRFDHQIEEIHGFRQLADCTTDAYDGILEARGTTSLYDAALNSIEAVAGQGVKLIAEEYSANAIVFVITDGLDYCGSTATPSEVKKAIQRAMKAECLESIVTVLIGVNVQDPSVAASRRRRGSPSTSNCPTRAPRVCAEHPDTGVPWCVAPCGPSLVCPTVGGLEFECLDGLCFPVL